MSSCITHGNHGNPREGARIGRAGHTHREMAQSQSREVPRWALVATAVTATSLGILWWTTSARSKKKKLPEPEGCHPIWGGIPLLAKVSRLCALGARRRTCASAGLPHVPVPQR